MMVLVLLVGAASAAASAAAAAAAAASAFTASVPVSGSSNKHGLDCDFESPCAWRWDAGGFVLASGASSLENGTAPATDASGNAEGHYLLVQSRGGPPLEYLVRSPRTPSTLQRCRLHLWLHMLNMDDGRFKVVIEKDVSPAVIVIDKRGNSDNVWRKHEFTIGRVSEDFQLALEAVTASGLPSHLAIDNITVIDCFPGVDTEVFPGRLVFDGQEAATAAATYNPVPTTDCAVCSARAIHNPLPILQRALYLSAFMFYITWLLL